MYKHALLTMLIVMNTGTGYAHSSNGNYYITDTVDIPMRSANKIQSNPSNLLRMLPSDTKLQLLSTDSGWTKVETADGTIGWVVSRYTTSKTPAKVTLKEMRRLNVKLNEDLEYMTDKCNKFRTTLEVL
jgi:SH3 domain protein